MLNHIWSNFKKTLVLFISLLNLITLFLKKKCYNFSECSHLKWILFKKKKMRESLEIENPKTNLYY